MIGELTNHLWQSTVFALAAGLMTAGFRKNRAHVRYWLWLGASFKFLLPFSLLIDLGSRLEWAPAPPAVTRSIVQVSQPFPDPAPLVPSTGDARDWGAIAIFSTWAFGFAAIVVIRARGWRGIQAAVRASTPMNIPGSMRIRSSPGLIEPGVIGLFRPILLLPAGIVERLKPSQLDAVLAHELCHVRRRDNLTSAIHMIVEAIFWFHPLVWWIGARLIEERERACDETVLSLGNEPHDYAEGILRVCKSYLESPLSCVSGVTGSNLKKRIQAILAGRMARDLNFAKKLALIAAGMGALGAPILLGIASAPPKFQAVSIRTCEAFRGRKAEDLYRGRLRSECTTVERFIQQAYGLDANGKTNPLSSVTVTGGPAWTSSALYEIDGKAAGQQSQATMNGPMLQALLEDRFKLKTHREIREAPVYELTVSKGGSRLEPFRGSCIPYWDVDYPPSHSVPMSQRCGTSRLTSNGVDVKGATMADLRVFFLVTLDRPVVDKTGMTGSFNFHLELPAEEFRRARGLPAFSDPAARATDPALISAIKSAVQKLGLNLEESNGPGEFVAIDHVEKSSGS